MSVIKTTVDVAIRKPTPSTAGEVKFTRQQYEYLNRVFAEKVGDANTTEAELRVSQGQRRVVHFIRERIDGSQVL